eukprot:4715693-Amphidinium_carterae.1
MDRDRMVAPPISKAIEVKMLEDAILTSAWQGQHAHTSFPKELPKGSRFYSILEGSPHNF